LASSKQAQRERDEFYRKEIADWRSYIKTFLYAKEGSVCLGCGRIMHPQQPIHMHEGILKRGDTPGLEWQWKNRHLFYAPINCILLHGDCHDRLGQSSSLRDDVMEFKVYQYEAMRVRIWLQRMSQFGLTKADELLRMYSELLETEDDPSE
jgi:hypothetical protein